MRAFMALLVIGAGALWFPVAAGADHLGPPVGTRAANPLNDLGTVGLGFGQVPDKVPTARRSEPPLVATPRASCVSGLRREPGIQGRVPAGSANQGLSCNVSLLGHEGSSGGFHVFRYVDAAGHECAFYDTALLFPLNAFNAGGSSLGVSVLDMSDPTHPKKTDTLVATSMLTPHESLRLNTRRGLLAAVNGNPGTEPGVVSIYDVHADCRHPVLDSITGTGRLGHESGFTPDGKTFYATSTALPGITAIDVSDPKQPHAIWQGNVVSHGMSLSDDGNRGYIADSSGKDMLILDTSQIQARKANPQAREISRLTWGAVSIPQNAVPFTKHGHPYVLEFDEYSGGTVGGNLEDVGAARIIDISDETKPYVVSDIRLQVNEPGDHKAAGNDPGASSPVQGYAAHYCNLPTRVDPSVVACSFIASGLRVFDITDVFKPKEIAYFVSPTQPRIEDGFQASDYAMSEPAIVPDRHEVWYTDGTTGFYALRVDDRVWPTCGDRIGPPHGYVHRSSLRSSRSGLSVRGSSFGLCLARDARERSRVTRVTVAVARYVGRRCRFLISTGGFTKLRSCRRPVALRVSGTSQAWRFATRRGHRLPKGHYGVYVQATDAAGRREGQPARPNARFVVR